MANKRTIEIFTASCPICIETVGAVKQAVAMCDCEVIERNVSSQAAKAYEIKAVPTIVINGQVVYERKPTPQEIASLILTS
jgi:glutaredoxin